jgi:hypothetical protein
MEWIGENRSDSFHFYTPDYVLVVTVAIQIAFLEAVVRKGMSCGQTG